MTPSVPSRRLPPPELPGHTWLRALGSGGFADVHLYRQEIPAREVAVKVARSVGDPVEYAQIRHEADVTRWPSLFGNGVLSGRKRCRAGTPNADGGRSST